MGSSKGTARSGVPPAPVSPTREAPLDLARAGPQAQGAMTTIKPGPTLGTAGADAREARKQRLAAALRENLRKRKAQARERAAPGEPTSAKSKQS